MGNIMRNQAYSVKGKITMKRHKSAIRLRQTPALMSAALADANLELGT